MKIIKISFLLIAFGIILGSHATPEMAIRSHVFFMGYPISAIKADIEEYKYGDGVIGYKITPPPIERATEGELDTYIVSKKWVFYFAKFDNDV